MDPSAVNLRPSTQYVLAEHQRSELQGEFGPILQTHELPAALADVPAIAAVGDRVSLTLRQLGIEPRLFVCDYHTQRGDLSDEFRTGLADWGNPVAVTNPPGQVTAEAWDACVAAAAADSFTRIEVTGEEDLLALPLFLAMPEGAMVLYGVPNRGVGAVMVNEPLRERVRNLLQRMG